MEATIELGLENCLNDFAASVNEHPRLDSLLKGWEPVILIEETSTPEEFSFDVKDRKIAAVRRGHVEATHSVLIRGDRDTLVKVFSGSLNPAQAHLEGDLEVFGEQRDQVKLDAISLILWGM